MVVGAKGSGGKYITIQQYVFAYAANEGADLIYGQYVLNSCVANCVSQGSTKLCTLFGNSSTAYNTGNVSGVWYKYEGLK